MLGFQEKQKLFLLILFHIKKHLQNILFAVLICVYNQFVKVGPMYTTMADKNFSYNLLTLNMQNGLGQKGCKCTYNLFALRFLEFF